MHLYLGACLNPKYMFIIDDLVLLGGSFLFGLFIGRVIAIYIERAIDWFKEFWNNHTRFRKNCKAIGVLLVHGYKVIKRYFVQGPAGEEEEFEDEYDEGEEISNLNLTPEVEMSMKERGYLVLDQHGYY